MTLNELAREIHENSANHGFWDECKINDQLFRPLVEGQIPLKLMLIVSETSEALEEYRSNNGGFPLESPYFKKDNPKKPEGVAVELVDALIRILDLCCALGVDVDTVVSVKHNYNKSRPYKHGRTC